MVSASPPKGNGPRLKNGASQRLRPSRMVQRERAQAAEGPAGWIAAVLRAQTADHRRQGIGDFFRPGTREPAGGLLAQQSRQMAGAAIAEKVVRRDRSQRLRRGRWRTCAAPWPAPTRPAISARNNSYTVAAGESTVTWPFQPRSSSSACRASGAGICPERPDSTIVAQIVPGRRRVDSSARPSCAARPSRVQALSSRPMDATR